MVLYILLKNKNKNKIGSDFLLSFFFLLSLVLFPKRGLATKIQHGCLLICTLNSSEKSMTGKAIFTSRNTFYRS